MLKKFIKQFRDSMHDIELFKDSKLSDDKSDIHSSSNNTSKILNSNSRKIKFEDLSNILLNLKIIKNSGSLDENKNLNNIFNELKDSEGLINKNDIFNFLLAILNFYEIYLIKRYKKNLKTTGQVIKETTHTESSKISIDEIKFNVLDLIEKDLENKIVKQRKYGGLDTNNDYIITIPRSKELTKDFNLFTINWNNSNSYSGKKKETPKNKIGSFKPIIDKNSIILSQNHRKKMVLIS